MTTATLIFGLFVGAVWLVVDAINAIRRTVETIAWRTDL